MEKWQRIDEKVSKLVDWNMVRYHTESIEEYIGKMERHRIDCTGDIRYELEKLEELFEEARDKALAEILKEDEEEAC